MAMLSALWISQRNVFSMREETGNILRKSCRRHLTSTILRHAHYALALFGIETATECRRFRLGFKAEQVLVENVIETGSVHC